jgi:hypothetical protein
MALQRTLGGSCDEFPALGFFIARGAIRGIGWVAAGFFQTPKLAEFRFLLRGPAISQAMKPAKRKPRLSSANLQLSMKIP